MIYVYTAKLAIVIYTWKKGCYLKRIGTLYVYIEKSVMIIYTWRKACYMLYERDWHDICIYRENSHNYIHKQKGVLYFQCRVLVWYMYRLRDDQCTHAHLVFKCLTKLLHTYLCTYIHVICHLRALFLIVARLSKQFSSSCIHISV